MLVTCPVDAYGAEPTATFFLFFSPDLSIPKCKVGHRSESPRSRDQTTLCCSTLLLIVHCLYTSRVSQYYPYQVSVSGCMRRSPTCTVMPYVDKYSSTANSTSPCHMNPSGIRVHFCDGEPSSGNSHRVFKRDR